MDELFAAIKGRDQTTVERILGADPAAASAVDEHGVSALLTAAYHDNAPAMVALRATGVEALMTHHRVDSVHIRPIAGRDATDQKPHRVKHASAAARADRPPVRPRQRAR